MASPVTSATHAPTVEQVAPVRPKAPEAKPQQPPADTVQISSAAKAALQEALETKAQTTQEANLGDNQARRLLAREAAAAPKATTK
ncbi:MAG TPA: hypothetical protein VI685_11265 [Candidatus Angelobacter sp.]